MKMDMKEMKEMPEHEGHGKTSAKPACNTQCTDTITTTR